MLLETFLLLLRRFSIKDSVIRNVPKRFKKILKRFLKLRKRFPKEEASPHFFFCFHIASLVSAMDSSDDEDINNNNNNNTNHSNLDQSQPRFSSITNRDVALKEINSRVTLEALQELYEGIRLDLATKPRRERFPDASVRIMDAVLIFAYRWIFAFSLRKLEAFFDVNDSSLQRHMEWILENVSSVQRFLLCCY